MRELARVYGLTVRSEVPLHLHRPVAAGTEVDLEIALGAPVARTEAAPPGRVLLDLRGSRHYYTATAHDGFRLRFFGSCDVVLDHGLSRATVHPVRGADPDLLSVLVGGTLLAFVLTMRGETVLHASAVQVGDAALAFIGASGMGKSTMATLMCADVARLITDDVLRLDTTSSPPTCALGATELRLRKGAEHLSARLAHQLGSAPGLRVTGDARHALAAEPATTEDLPLAALVVPVPDHSPGRRTPEIALLAPKDAMVLLAQFPRLLGWQDAAARRAIFHQLADVVDRVPVHAAVLPWGPPFSEDIASQVLRATRLTAGEGVEVGSAV
ncbi:phosphoenolpyruvate carboxykinase (ATP) [Nocardioides dilutus]